MSFFYSVIKPTVRKKVKGSSLHQEESYEEFKQASYDIQSKFKFELPKIKDIEFRDEQLNGFHIIIGKKFGSSPKKAVVYFPGGGSRRWQLPFKGSMKNYIEKTGAELWIPLYPLAPYYTLLDEAEFTVQMHKKCSSAFLHRISYGSASRQVRIFCSAQDGILSKSTMMCLCSG